MRFGQQEGPGTRSHEDEAAARRRWGHGVRAEPLAGCEPWAGRAGQRAEGLRLGSLSASAICNANTFLPAPSPVLMQIPGGFCTFFFLSSPLVLDLGAVVFTH